MERPSTLDHFKSFAPRVAFFVLCFQDVLRLVHACSTDPSIKAMAKVHALEDSGHDRWYLNDLQRLGIQLPVQWLFSEGHQLTRDVAYRQISTVLHAHYDQTRLAVALSLEAIGSECFGRAIALLESIGAAADLEYFARKHQAIEQGHQVFESESQKQLSAIGVPIEAVLEVKQAVADTFEGMSQLLTDLEGAFTAQT
ncbi:MAG: iron-containing redox enzyme family protein [Polyangiaceae bacterium]